MKYQQSDHPLAALLRSVDSHFGGKAGASVLRRDCELLTDQSTAMMAFGGFLKFIDCFPAHLQIDKGRIVYLHPLSSADLTHVLQHKTLLLFDLCASLAPKYQPTPVDSVIRSMTSHPGCSDKIIAKITKQKYMSKILAYSQNSNDQWCVTIDTTKFAGDKCKCMRSIAKLLHDQLQTQPKLVTASKSNDTTSSKSQAQQPQQAQKSSSATSTASKAKVAPAAASTTASKTSTTPSAPASASQSAKPKPITTAPAPTPQPTKPKPTPAPDTPNVARDSVEASARSSSSPSPTFPNASPADSNITNSNQHCAILVQSAASAKNLSSFIAKLEFDYLGIAAVGDRNSRDLASGIDLIQLAIYRTRDDDDEEEETTRLRPIVLLWDIGRADGLEERRSMIESLASALTSVVNLGGLIFVHDVGSLGEALVSQDWFDLGSIFDINMLFAEWCELAHEAQGLMALVDSHAKDSSRKVPPSLVMSAAERAKLLAPVALQRVPAAHGFAAPTSQAIHAAAQLNDILRACNLPIDDLHDTVDSLVQKHLVAFHEAAVKRQASLDDHDDMYTPAAAALPTPADSDDESHNQPRTFARKPYWSLHSDPVMLARAAAQKVDQLDAAFKIAQTGVVLLEDWKRRAKTYLAATQHLYHGQWSLNPRLPKYIPIQSRFTDDGRLMWRYSVSAARGIEGDGGEQDIGAAGASEDLQLVHEQFTHRIEEEVQDLLALLPDRVRAAVLAIPDAVHSLNEVILDLGEPARLRFFALDQAAMDLKHIGRVTQEDIDAIVEGRMFSSDRRGGINGQLHRISWVANREGKAIGLTIRVGRACPPGEGVTQMLLDLVTRGESVLFLGKPGSGKTHTLRDFVARLSDTGNNVMIVDTSNEVGGPGDVKHFSLHKARRLQVRDRSRQFEVLLEAVQNHTPDIVCIDEISDAKEVAAARSVATRVKGMVATAHGDLESILRNKVMRDLLGGLQTATVGDARAKELGGRKTVTTRAEEPLFTTVVELVSRTEVRVFQNVGRVVDMILHPHGFPWAERRWLPSSEDDGLLAGRSSVSDRGGKKFFLAQVEPFEKPDLEGPQGLGTA